MWSRRDILDMQHSYAIAAVALFVSEEVQHISYCSNLDEIEQYSELMF